MHLESSSEFEEVIAKLNNSESLDLPHRIMISTGPIDMGRLVESIKNTKHNVIALTINSIKLTEDEIKKLEDVFTHCALLESLDLSNNDLTSKEAEILAGILANNKTIKSLSLNNNKIGDNGLKAFAKIAENSSIENLNFSDNNISDKGFKYWAETLKKNTSLTNFNFHNNKIHDEGAKALAEVLLSNTSIKRFTIAVEGLTNETRELLKKVVNDKDIIVKQSPATKLLPDALDVWVEDNIPEPEPQQPVKEIPVSPEIISNYEEEGLESNENKFNPETTLELLDEYGKKFNTALEKGEILDKLNIKPNTTGKEEQKALIILGHPGSGKTTLANLFATETLTIGIKKEGKLLKPDYSSSNKAVINIAKPDPNLIICESNYLHDKLSTPEKIINEFYITKILSNYPTKFIVTIKDSELKNEFIAIIEKLSILLKDIPLTPDSLYLVITDVPRYKNSDNIFYTLVYIIRKYSINCNLNHTYEAWGEKQQEIEGYLAQQTSLYIFPTFYPETIGLGEFEKILEKFPPLIKENNKIAVGSTDISDILTLQSYIKEGLRDGISKLSDKIKTKWEKEKASLFILGTEDIRDGCIIQPNTEALKKLQGIFKWLKKPGNDSSNNNIIDNDTAKFLALNNALYEVLIDKELNDKLNSYVDYLKYLAAINVGGKAPIAEEQLFSSNNPDNWFKMLADGVLSIGDINKQLVESFKTAMQNSFCCRLETFVKEFFSSTKVLGEDTISNIYNLKFLQSILTDEGIKKTINSNISSIKSFTLIEDRLLLILNTTPPSDKLALDLDAQMVKNNIKVLKELVIECDLDYDPKILNEIWQEFTGSVSVSINIDEIIYNKLLTAEIPYKMEIRFYNKLLELISLKDVESADLSSSHIKAHYSKLAEIYCKMGNVSFDGTEIFENCNLGGNKVDFDPAFTG